MYTEIYILRVKFAFNVVVKEKIMGSLGNLLALRVLGTDREVKRELRNCVP